MVWFLYLCRSGGCGITKCIVYVSGIGVPILLGYVYGVVPISLCRSGGCGITKCIVCVSGIGVPILLGYVYGVVPISLCRS